jgi:transcriptional regulator GlxA family with amidase domain
MNDFQNARIDIAIVTFEEFNEIDTFVALSIINRLRPKGIFASIACPGDSVTSMNGVSIKSQRSLQSVNGADAVLFGSGKGTRAAVENDELMSMFELDCTRQLVGSQCSGALILEKLGLLGVNPVCTDRMTRPYLEKAGVSVLDKSFHAVGNVATAGGCLSSQYLATWVISHFLGYEAAIEAMEYVAPYGEESSYSRNALVAIKSQTPNLSKDNFEYREGLHHEI